MAQKKEQNDLIKETSNDDVTSTSENAKETTPAVALIKITQAPVELTRTSPKRGDPIYGVRYKLNDDITLNTKRGDIKESMFRLICKERGITSMQESVTLGAKVELHYGLRSDGSTYRYAAIKLSKNTKKLNLFLDSNQEVMLEINSANGKAYDWELKEIADYEKYLEEESD
ncbi:MAG: hypothetical protein FWE36_05140 [Erysipelotrichales bacterium]|nr:hypothetical protein [Erysipelotrichales bacterium]